MKISREEYKNIRYICKKFKISPESLHIKTLAATLDKRLLRRRFVLGFAVKHTRTGNFLVWNSLKRIDIRNRFLSKKESQRHKNIHHKSWRRAVRKVRKSNNPVKTVEEIVKEADEPQQVRDKLKEQLQLLQQGKKNKLTEESNPSSDCNGETLSRKSSRSDDPSFLGECLDDDDDMESLRVTPDLNSECGSDVKEEKRDGETTITEHKTPIKNSTNVISDDEKTPKLSDTGYNSPTTTPSKKGFLDSLLNKFKSSDVDVSKSNVTTKKKEQIDEELKEENLPPPVLIPMATETNQRTTRMRARKAIHQIKNAPEESQDSHQTSPKNTSKDTSKSDLFKLGEKQVPGLLATPKAMNTRASAFVDQESAEEVKIKLEKIDEAAMKNFDQKEHEGLVCSGIKPPHLEKPKKLVDLVRPRTVAEKRQLMQKKKGIKFLMMENESKIFNELAKINREDYDYQFNFPMLTALQKETVPYRRDAWRALSFLKTEKNRFFYKVLYVDGVKCNLLGSRGNFDGKKKFKASSTPFPKYVAYRNRNPCCKQIKLPKGIKFNLEVPSEVIPELEPVKKLLDYDKTMLNMKPGPLSQKLRKQTSRLSTDECLGPLELYTMPTVELEVHPKLGRQIDPKIHPYLKYLLPYENITETWAKFSVSILKDDKHDDTKEEKFSFPIPYSNNQNKIMIRRRRGMKQNFSIEDKALTEVLEKPLSSASTISPDDLLGLEIANILKEMMNSVAIGMSESSFIQNDPDLDYTKTDKPLEITSAKAVAAETNVSKRIMRELRKLNATFITADNQAGKCTEKFCEKGCVCDSLTTLHNFKNHCKKQDCMIECNCASNRFHVHDEVKDCTFTSDEVQSLRAKATARLAPIEKDFTPTLVLSNNSTYLIPGSDREHTRRSKKVPKRYSDFVDSSKCIIGNGEESGEIIPLTELTKSKFAPKDPLEAAVYQMKHCNVILRPLQNVSQIEPWCMVHRLYKCFCNGQVTEGRPFTFDDLEEGLQERFDYGYRKPRYEFERNDVKESAATRNRRLSSSNSSGNLSFFSPSPSKSRRSSTGLLDLDSFEYSHIDTNVSQRCIPIDEKYIIRDPKETKLKKMAIQKYEQRHSHTEELLKKRLIECERHFHRELRKRVLRQENTRQMDEAQKEEAVVPVDLPSQQKPKSRLSRPIRLNIQNSEEEIEAYSILKPLVRDNVVLIATGKNKIYAKKHYFYAGKLDFTKVMEKAQNTIFIIEKTPEQEANNNEFLRNNKFIRRTKLVDLKLILNIIKKPESEGVKELTSEFNSSQDGPEDNGEFSHSDINVQPTYTNHQIGAQKIQHINSMISRAMQYICKLQKQNSPQLVEPTQSKMYFFTWKAMTQGFQQNLLSVWEIKCTGNRCAVVVTQGNIVPNIEFLEEIKNIRELTAETPGLSLFSKMLLLKVDGDRTKNLSLVLYGGINFWRITGFVNSENDYQNNGVIARPTPETQPQLSNKINNLFNLLHNRKQLEAEDAVSEMTGLNSNKKKYKSNIKICSTDKGPSIKSLYLPIPEVPHQRWFMLQIESDFSDIFIPNWNDYLSYDKISYALALAKQHSKTVRVTMNDKFPEIYATPRRSNCIFFGPYGLHDNIDYILCQNIDGEIVDRQTYEEKYNIKKDKETFGSWLYPKRDGDSTSQEGEPSPKIRKVSPIKIKTSDSSLPLVISQVQTAITDPNLIPTIDSSDEEKSELKKITGKRLSVDIIPSKPEKRMKVEESSNPLKVTLLRKDGEGYAIKAIPLPSTAVKATSDANKRVSLPEHPQTDHNLMGKRISLPLSVVKGMTPMIIKKGVTATKPIRVLPVTSIPVKSSTPVQILKSVNSETKPGTSNATKDRILYKPVTKIVQKIIKTTQGIPYQPATNQDPVTTIKAEKEDKVDKITDKLVSQSSENKIQKIKQSLPSSITVSQVKTESSDVKRSMSPNTVVLDDSVNKKVSPDTVMISHPIDKKETLNSSVETNPKPMVAINNLHVHNTVSKPISTLKPIVINNPKDVTSNDTVQSKPTIILPTLTSRGSACSTTFTKPDPNVDFINGFFISDIIPIGKIVAEKRGNKLILKMRNSDRYYVRRQFLAGQSTQYLNRYLRGLVHSFIPENFVLAWRFETNKAIVDKYPEHDPNKVPRKMVITKHGGISLRQNWDQLAHLEQIDKNIYLKILLIKLAEDCFPDERFDNFDVLQILQSSQREIENLEENTPKLVRTKSDERKKNTELKQKWETLRGKNPDVKLPTEQPEVMSIENVAQEPSNKPEDDDDDDDVQIISFGKKGIEIICLDDDDD